MCGGFDAFTKRQLGITRRMTKKIDIMKKRWASLSQLKAHLEKESREKVLAFNGHELITNEYQYTLAHGELHREKK